MGTSAAVGIGARALASGFTGAVLWFIIGRSFQVNGQPALQLAPWPLGQWWLWVGVGLAVGFALESIRVVRSRRRGQELESLCQQLGFDYQSEAPASTWEVWRPLARFANTYSVTHGMRGEVADIPFEIYDHRRRIVEGKSTSYSEETVILFDVGESNLPTFELQPRTIGLRILAAAGVGEISVERESAASGETGRDSTPLTDDSREESDYDAFQSAYHLSLGPRERLRALTGESEATEADVAQVRRLFDRRLVQFLSERPKWHLESTAGKLAIWRPREIMAPSERPRFLAEALALRAALVDAADAPPAPANAPAALAKSNGEATDSLGAHNADAPTRLAAAAFGGMSGFALGGFVGGTAAIAIVASLGKPAQGPEGLHILLAAVIFFGSAILGLVAGALLGHKVLGRLLALIRGVKAVMPGSGVTDELATPPAGSLARVERLGDEVRVEFPAQGVLRGSGCFLAVWSGFWNLFVFVSTPLFMNAALQGQVKNEAGQPQSPLAVALFLVPFWLVGLGSLLAIVYQARRRTSFVVSPTRLRVEATTVFGRTESQWSNDEIQSIETTTTDTGRARVVIQPFDGAAASVLGDRTHLERRWLTQLLRATLRPATRPQPS